MVITKAVLALGKEILEAMDRGIDQRISRGHFFERAVADAFRQANWRVDSQPSLGSIRPDLLVRRGNRQYVAEIKSSSEVRRDRLVPLLAQAILQAKAAAAKLDPQSKVLPLAIVGVPRLSRHLFEDLRAFAAEVAPDVSIGLVDLEGSRIFAGPELDNLNKIDPSSDRSVSRPSPVSRLNLFSDLNQWMMKVLLSPYLPEGLIGAPRSQVHSISDLAKAADVSLMSASRCVNSLRAQGFIDRNSEVLQLVNVEELLAQWRSANRNSVHELAMHWIIPGAPERQLQEALHIYLNASSQAMDQNVSSGHQGFLRLPRACMALFAAADALGFGFVRGVAPHLYFERYDPRALESFGLLPAQPGQRVGVLLRIPAFRESVFRAVVIRKGVPVCDIFQLWLDVVDHPARGANQAQEIWHRVLAPLSKGVRK